MYYTGIDLHRKTSFFTTIDESGQVVTKANLPNDDIRIMELKKGRFLHFARRAEPDINNYCAKKVRRYLEHIVPRKSFNNPYFKQNKKEPEMGSFLIGEVPLICQAGSAEAFANSTATGRERLPNYQF